MHHLVDVAALVGLAVGVVLRHAARGHAGGGARPVLGRGGREAVHVVSAVRGVVSAVGVGVAAVGPMGGAVVGVVAGQGEAGKGYGGKLGLPVCAIVFSS